MKEWKLPEKIVWRSRGMGSSDKADAEPISRWWRFDEIESKACIYGGYENEEMGEDFPGGLLYIRFSKRAGSVTGVKLTPDSLYNVAKAWDEYDTPLGALRGDNYLRYLSKVHAEEVTGGGEK